LLLLRPIAPKLKLKRRRQPESFDKSARQTCALTLLSATNLFSSPTYSSKTASPSSASVKTCKDAHAGSARSTRRKWLRGTGGRLPAQLRERRETIRAQPFQARQRPPCASSTSCSRRARGGGHRRWALRGPSRSATPRPSWRLLRARECRPVRQLGTGPQKAEERRARGGPRVRCPSATLPELLSPAGFPFKFSFKRQRTWFFLSIFFFRQLPRTIAFDIWLAA